MAARRSQEYRFRTAFHAPLPFVFRWCTDYQPSDARLENEGFERRIVERGPRRVIFEDIEETPQGWTWRRHVVTLRPPDRWHSDSVGNYRDFQLDYRLRPLRDGRTELTFRGRRRPAILASKNPTVEEFRRSMDASWRHFRRHLENDYRRSLARRGTRRRSRPRSR